MNWLYFDINTFLSDYGALLLFCLLLVVFIIVMVVSTLLIKRRHREYSESLADQTSTVRVVRMDLDKNEVVYFNLKDMDMVKQESLQSYLSSFPQSENRRLMSWAEDQLHGVCKDDFIECQVYISSKKKISPTYLSLIYLDKAKKRLYLESHMLARRVEKKKLPHKRLSTSEDFFNVLKRSPSGGATFCFSYQLGEDKKKSSKGYENIPERVESLIRPFVTGNQLLLRPEKHDFIIANFDISEEGSALSFALGVCSYVNRELLSKRKSGMPLITLKCGVVLNKEMLYNGELLIGQARAAAKEAFAKKGVSAHIYKKGDPLIEESLDSSFKSEVERIISEKKIIYSYRAIVSIKQKRIVGYLGKAEPLKDTSFESMEELENYAHRAKETKKLFANIVKSLLPRFAAERLTKSQSLYIPVSYFSLDYVLASLIRNPANKGTNIYLWLKDSEIAANIIPKDLAHLKENLQTYKSYNYKICLEVSTSGPLIDKSLLSLVDSFLIDFSSYGPSVSIDTRARSDLNALVDRLQKYKKPIIGSSLENWSAIELVASFGVDYLSSDVILPFEAMFRPLGEKTMDRLRLLKERIE